MPSQLAMAPRSRRALAAEMEAASAPSTADETPPLHTAGAASASSEGGAAGAPGSQDDGDAVPRRASGRDRKRTTMLGRDEPLDENFSIAPEPAAAEAPRSQLSGAQRRKRCAAVLAIALAC